MQYPTRQDRQGLPRSSCLSRASETAKERARVAAEKTREAVRETTIKAKDKLKKGKK